MGVIQPEEGETQDKFRYIKALPGSMKTYYIIPLVREQNHQLRNPYFSKDKTDRAQTTLLKKTGRVPTTVLYYSMRTIIDSSFEA